MQKINLLLLMTIVFSVGLLASCSDDAGSNTVIDVPAKQTAAKESSFDYKVTKPCGLKENAHELPLKNYDLDADGDISDEELETNKTICYENFETISAGRTCCDPFCRHLVCLFLPC